MHLPTGWCYAFVKRATAGLKLTFTFQIPLLISGKHSAPQLTIHCSYYSMATIYAIENNIPFEQIGTYTDSAETVLDRSDTSYYGDFGSATANGYVAMTVRYNIKDTWKSAVSDLNVKLVLPSNGELDESTLKVDGELCQNYNLKDRTLTIPVS